MNGTEFCISKNIRKRGLRLSMKLRLCYMYGKDANLLVSNFSDQAVGQSNYNYSEVNVNTGWPRKEPDLLIFFTSKVNSAMGCKASCQTKSLNHIFCVHLTQLPAQI